jgi:predicted patatin/cPLA2 family phospholipase
VLTSSVEDLRRQALSNIKNLTNDFKRNFFGEGKASAGAIKGAMHVASAFETIANTARKSGLLGGGALNSDANATLANTAEDTCAASAPKTAIIDVGGGMRGIYAAGVFDRCMDEHITFDMAFGISAGSANVISFLANQLGRNFYFYMECSFRPQYMGVGNYLRNHNFVDLDYIYSTLSNSDGEYPLDYPAIVANPTEMYILACDAFTGEAKYFDKNDIAQDNYDVCKASSALPFACKPYVIGGREYFDGALGDTIPIQRALDEGAEKIVLVLTKPADALRTADKDIKTAKLIEHKYPVAAERLRLRAKRYNEGVAFARELATEGRALIVAPDDTCGVDTLKRNKKSMEQLYGKGFADGGAIREFLAK